jgi:hypothetical protein
MSWERAVWDGYADAWGVSISSDGGAGFLSHCRELLSEDD